MRIPELLGTTLPRVEQTKAHFAILVQVRVKADSAAASRSQLNERRLVRIVGRKGHIEHETSAGVRRIRRSHNEHLHRIQALAVTAQQDAAAERQRQRVGSGQRGRLLG